MEIKILHRNPEDYNKNKRFYKHNKNYDKKIHLFQREIEYKRALNATKLDKIFAKPLVKCFDEHNDAIRCLCLSQNNICDLYSGSCDGFINSWNITNSKLIRKIKAHEGFVRSLCASIDDKFLFSCGDDKYIKQWLIADINDVNNTNDVNNLNEILPKNIYKCKTVPNTIDKHYSHSYIICGSNTLDIYDYYTTNPIASFDYNNEYIYYVKCNYAEKNLVALSLSDNTIGLVDIRNKIPLKKIALKYRTNSISWNNLNPFYFTTANEDSNLYTFDIRYLDKVNCIYKGFVNAVLDVDYSPLGNKFVACSYDKTIRLFNINNKNSYDVYHTKRMQHVLCCKFSLDDKYVLSGSSDMCLRIWKSCSYESSKVKSIREQEAINYRNKLKEKFSNMKEIKRIRDYHHVPSLIKSLSDKKKEMIEARLRKLKNKIKHSKNKNQQIIPEKQRILVESIKDEKNKKKSKEN